MRILIAEDDHISRKFMQTFLKRFGECDLALDGLEAIDFILTSIKENNHYDLICLDIMMPKVDGMTVLKSLRDVEKQYGIVDDEKTKVIMTTALNDQKIVTDAYEMGCGAFACKPIDVDKFIEVLKNFKLVE